MPNTTDIKLEIAKANNGFPPDVDHSNNDDKVPWRMAQFRRKELDPSQQHRGIGKRPKFPGYFYRFTGGNSKFGNSTTDKTNDGDFEFEPNRGKSTVTISIITPNWTIESINLTPPLLQTNSLPATTVELHNDTNDKSVQYGQIGLGVGTTAGQPVSLYVDPDWANR